MEEPRDLRIEILDRGAIDDLIGKVGSVAAHPGAADDVRRWRAEHGTERATPRARRSWSWARR